MRKPITILASLLMFAGLAKAQNIHNCGTTLHQQELRAQNPALYDAAAQAFEQKLAEVQQSMALGKKADKIIIPVVFHVFYDETNAGNLSDAQINGIMTSLNKYFNADPSLVSNVRDIFKPIVANTNIEFRLAKRDPNGNCTNGIVRVQTSLATRATNDIKKISTWDTKKYLNIWTAVKVYSNGREVGGFAQLPHSGLVSNDGLLVVASQALADNTVAHEIGHSFGLLHPFEGSATDSCGSVGDNVDDTPKTYFLYAEGSLNTGRPVVCNDTTFNTCANEDPDYPDQQENIMDYFSGAPGCIVPVGVMFTLGQEARMRAALATYRANLYTAANLAATGVEPELPNNCAPIPAFSIKAAATNNHTFERTACVGTAINFMDLTYNGTATSWKWDFGAGANPQTSTDKNPTNIVYSTPGEKTITITVSNANGETTRQFEKALVVLNPQPLNLMINAPDYPNAQEGWTLTSEDNVQWVREDRGVFEGNYSIKLPGSNFNMFGKEYTIVSPSFDLSNAAAPYFQFRYAFARNAYGSSADATTDAMRVEASTNCGLHWSSLRSISGAGINTIPENINNPSGPKVTSIPATVSFVPTNEEQWTLINIANISSIKQPNVRFRITFASAGGNNLFIDDIRIGQKTGVEELTAKDINLNVYPNPFSSSTKIVYDLPKSDNVLVEVYDVVGRKVTTLVNEKQTEGLQEVVFDKAKSNAGTGLYFIKINVGSSTITEKVMVH